MRGLPPGFRFEPTEEELVFEYLKCKVFSSALPASIIPDINGVWNLDPWDIPAGGGGVGGGDREEEKYLFSKKAAAEDEQEYVDNNNNNMGIVGWSRSGYWKARGWEKEILSSDIGVRLVGMKKTLDFYSNTKKTGWVMHQYRLQLRPHSSHYSAAATNLVNNNWVLCRIFCNKLFNHHHLTHRPLHYSISSTNHQHQDLDHRHCTITALSDDDDSLSSTASSSSTSAAFTDFTSPTTTTSNPFPPF
ncbi:NAC domain-containing protein 83-like [Benincasa hispida]|uniref:NAC domain-containing protein 83-like n=1 Tax=Benincasa hispida TaxID=102211 RepID=UPI001900F66A|nr:NAC domain-containing protein 83-like [Benincasa hispida]